MYSYLFCIFLRLGWLPGRIGDSGADHESNNGRDKNHDRSRNIRFGENEIDLGWTAVQDQEKNQQDKQYND